MRKGGAGTHNWGAMRDEMELEREALEDAELDSGELEELPNRVNAAVRPAVDGASEAATKAPTQDEFEKAREFRAKGLKGDGRDTFAALPNWWTRVHKPHNRIPNIAHESYGRSLREIHFCS